MPCSCVDGPPCPGCGGETLTTKKGVTFCTVNDCIPDTGRHYGNPEAGK